MFKSGDSTPLWSYEAADYPIPVSISADGEYIVTGSGDFKVYLFDKDSSTPLWSYTSNEDIMAVDISADGEYIVAGDQFGYVSFFHKSSSTPLWKKGIGGEIRDVSISSDGNYIAVGNAYYGNSKLVLFNKDSDDLLWSYSADDGDHMLSTQISADGEYIVACDYDGYIYFFHRDSSTPIWKSVDENRNGMLKYGSISADGQYFVATEDGRDICNLQVSQAINGFKFDQTEDCNTDYGINNFNATLNKVCEIPHSDSVKEAWLKTEVAIKSYHVVERNSNKFSDEKVVKKMAKDFE